MEYPYINQTSRKAALKVSDFIMFSDVADITQAHSIDSGIIIERKEHRILVAHEDNDGKQNPVWYELDTITLFRDSDWVDPDLPSNS